MKIIGKNSLSQHISYLLFVLFIVTALNLTYEIIGHLCLLYKYKSGNNILSNTFLLANDVGWNRNKWTIPIESQLKFRINYPFSKIQMTTGLYNFSQIIFNIITMFFISLFFYFSYKCFKEMSSERIFNQNAIKWLTRLSWLNIAFSLVIFISNFFFFKMSPFAVLQFLFIGFFGIIILFIVEFFKKGYELQSVNDLTI